MNKKAYYFFYIIIFFILFLAIAFLSRNCCFWEDDEYYAVIQYMYHWLSCLDFKSEHGGGYIGYFLTKFFCFFLPLKLNIHPADFICSPYYAFIKSIIIFSVLLCISNFINFFKKSSINILFFIFLCSYFFYSVFSTYSYVLVLNYQFFRYCFSILFFAFFIFFIFRHLLSDNKKINYIQLIFAMMSGYIAGASSEILIFALGVLYGLTVIYNLFARILHTKYENIKPLNTGLIFHIAYIPYFISAYLFLSSPGFYNIAMELRGLNNIHIGSEQFFNFLNLYFIVLFKHELLYWIICGILLFILIFKLKVKKKEIVFPLIFQLVILALYFSLILCGETGGSHSEITIDGHHSLYYITHKQLRFLFEMIMLIPLFMYYSLFISYIGENQQKKIKKIVSGILIILSIFSVLSAIKMYDGYIGNKYLAQLKKENYILEKIFRYRILTNQDFINMPLSINAGTFRPSHWFYDYNGFVFYYKTIYNPQIELPSRYEVNDSGKNYFYKTGGIITEEEIKNIKFSRLFDENFVLNMSEQKPR